MAADQCISADSHVLEPAALWTERMNKPYRDQAPLVVQDHLGQCPTALQYWLSA